jgi:hypothetical protein
MGNLGEFDANGVQPAESFEPIPPGKYRAAIVESEVCETRAKTGTYAKFTWAILDGPFANRRIWQNCNLANPNPKAEEIGQRELSAVCHACGKLRPGDSAALHNIPCIIKVKIAPAKGEYEARNEIAGVEAVESDAPVPAPVPSAPVAKPAAAPVAAGAGTAPWLRKKQ